jgi:hypothetical protein
MAFDLSRAQRPMPICTTCTHPAPYLYTVYQSAHNLRLEQCVRIRSDSARVSYRCVWTKTKCNAFADPYVEHDTLTLVLDLILLKRGVYRHLIYNRGTPPRRLMGAKRSEGKDGGSGTEDKVVQESGSRERVSPSLIECAFVEFWIYCRTVAMAAHSQVVRLARRCRCVHVFLLFFRCALNCCFKSLDGLIIVRRHKGTPEAYIYGLSRPSCQGR